MNKKMIGKILGYLFLMEAIFMIPAGMISLARHEMNSAIGIFSSVIILCLLFLVLMAFCRNASQRLQAREGFVTVALAWILMSFLGGLPFFISGEIPSLMDCFFETTSGFTTTGASILTDIQRMSYGLLYWRSFTNWFGGMGMLVFLLAVLQNARGSGNFLHLLRAESPGPSVSKMVPKTKKTAKILYSIYILLTLICILLLLVGGMPLFDSICASFSTAGTGGFAIHNNSMAGYSPYCQNVITLFMILFGINFNIYYLLILKEFRAVFREEELRLYIGLILISIALITWNIMPMYHSLAYSLHHVAFTVASIITTTGFATVNFDVWPQFSKSILLILMILGASAGSTGGGLKSIRILILFKNIRRQIRKMLYPRNVEIVKVNDKMISEDVVNGVNTYTVIYFFVLFAAFLLISLDNNSFVTSFTATVACFNNIGPGFDLAGPASNYAFFSPFSKLILSLSMILGRLEIFPVLILFSPHTWSKRK